MGLLSPSSCVTGGSTELDNRDEVLVKAEERLRQGDILSSLSRATLSQLHPEKLLNIHHFRYDSCLRDGIVAAQINGKESKRGISMKKGCRNHVLTNLLITSVHIREAADRGEIRSCEKHVVRETSSYLTSWACGELVYKENSGSSILTDESPVTEEPYSSLIGAKSPSADCVAPDVAATGAMSRCRDCFLELPLLLE